MSSKTSSYKIPRSALGSPARSALDFAVDKAVNFLLDQQTGDGCWVGELEGDTILESEYIILLRFLDRGSESKLRKAAAYIRANQMENGGWPVFPGGPTDVSASVEAYFALKLMGEGADEPQTTRGSAGDSGSGWGSRGQQLR